MELPQTDHGNMYVLVFQDFLTKWPFAFPIPDQKSSRIAELLVSEVVPSVWCAALLSDCITSHAGCLQTVRHLETQHHCTSPRV